MGKNQMDVIIFDKDGVLLNLNATWLPVAIDITHLLSDLTDNQHPASLFQRIIGISPDDDGIDPNGLFATGSFLDQQAACAAIVPELQRHFDDPSYREKVIKIVQSHSQNGPVPLGDITTPLMRLQKAGYKMAILTNDAEASARFACDRLDITSFFEMIVGFDTGYGGKPAPQGFHAICEHLSVPAHKAIMVGDTSADRNVAEAAGAGLFVGISSLYPEPTDNLKGVPHILPSILKLPDLLSDIQKQAS